MSTRRRATNLGHETMCKEAMKDMATAIREQVALTNQMLQQMKANDNVVASVLALNLQFQGLSKF